MDKKLLKEILQQYLTVQKEAGYKNEYEVIA